MYRLSLKAAPDLDDIWDYVFEISDSETVADKQIHAITDRLYPLATHPKLGRARDYDLGRGRRSYPVNRYIIVYRVADDDVLILRIAHSARDLRALMRL